MKDWHPKGILVAHLHEHKGAVNRIRATKDNLFFATCSDDGTGKGALHIYAQDRVGINLLLGVL